jgi:pyruvate kinase
VRCKTIEHLFGLNLLDKGDRVLRATGDHIGELGGTNTLKLLRVGKAGIADETASHGPFVVRSR